MDYVVVVADDQGICSSEVSHILENSGAMVVATTTLEETIETVRRRQPSLIIVYVGMKRAFSLVRLLRHSEDLKVYPLIIVAEPDQQKLIEKHRQLPSRADRYLLRPLDGELLRSVVEDILGTTDVSEITGQLVEEHSTPVKGGATPPPLHYDANAYEKLAEELEKYKAKVAVLERDLKAALGGARRAAELEQENQTLRQEIAKLKKFKQNAEIEAELFGRLEEEYRDAIQDLKKELQEKEEALRAAKNSLTEKELDIAAFKEMESKLTILRDRNTQLEELTRELVKNFEQLDHQSEQLNLAEAVETVSQEDVEEFSAPRTFDEATLVMDLETIKKKLEEEH